MKNIKFLIFAFVVVNLSVIYAFGAEKTKDSDKFNEYKHINVVCVNEECFKKIEAAYAKVNCDLILLSREVIEHERSFIERSTLQRYKLSGCMKPIEARVKIQHTRDEGEPRVEPKCIDGYKFENLKTERGTEIICIQDNSQKREKINHEAKDLKKKVQQIK